ncbi:MAG: glutamate--tRNA ligase [Pseudomonadota bacterium]
MQTDHVVTRFAPSPTGRLHLGNARTALFNALLARAAGGRFLLRLEDTDTERSEAAHEHALLDDLRWLGLTWDGGPDGEAGAGPWRQSEREAKYAELFARLEASGHAYPCYCSEAELAAERDEQRRAGRPPRYAGRCRHLDAERRAERAAEGRRPVLRFRVPDSGAVVFDDRLRGEQRTEAASLGDFVIRRADGSPGFLFANAVDDALMGVTHVLRGEDHLSNTPRQILILEALGLAAPRYGHLGLIVESDGSPLSKRRGGRSLGDLREAGFLPEAVVNALARLGHSGGRDELLALDELAAGFEPARLGRGPARFDFDQLLHWQRAAVAAADNATLWAWLDAGIHERIGAAAIDGEAFVAAIRENIRLPEEAVHWAAVVADEVPTLDEEARTVIDDAGGDFFMAALEALALHGTEFGALAKEVGRRTGTRGRALYQPLRAALTGRINGPELGPLLALMGADRARRRLQIHVSER